MRVGRRKFLPMLAAPVLAGCGFRPVYGPASSGAEGPAATGLAEISIGIIPERAGQLLRLALQERFERGGSGVARRYDLNVSFGISGDQLAIRPDSAATWVRFVGTANYTLISQVPGRPTITSGVARAMDGYNLFDQQYFASDLETEAVQRRLTQAIADQIALQLASYFAKQPASKNG